MAVVIFYFINNQVPFGRTCSAGDMQAGVKNLVIAGVGQNYNRRFQSLGFVLIDDSHRRGASAIYGELFFYPFFKKPF